jgi:hypothetical protein
MNIFQQYIDSGRIGNSQDLKKCFWSIVKTIHPDISNTQNTDESFIAVKRDFDEMLQQFKENNSGPTKKEPITDSIVISGFIEIAESGFPVDIRIRNESKLYIKRINEYSGRIIMYKMPGVESFMKVEDELYKIRGDNIIDNPLFGKLRMIFYNICSYYYEPKEYAKKSINKWNSEIRDELIKGHYNNLLSFIEWFLNNLINKSESNMS